MKILVTGASGFVGSALVPHLRDAGHTPVPLVRSRPDSTKGTYHWDIATGAIDPRALDGADAIVHLAGENIGAGRWTAARKGRIHDSRVDGTRRLCEHLAALDAKPPTLISSSAIGFYGDTGDETVDETSGSGDGFLADVCRGWEDATTPARDAGIRVVNVRSGIVLGRRGPLAKMLPPFKACVGGVVGSGRQYMSWISIDDMVAVLACALGRDDLQGPINAVGPNPSTNREFTKTLGRVLGRPTIFPLPAFLARLVFGEMADALLLASTRVAPTRLLEIGFEFQHPTLTEALRAVLRH
jgi:uncharacterized protein (TIGR01777 family)